MCCVVGKPPRWSSARICGQSTRQRSRGCVPAIQYGSRRPGGEAPAGDVQVTCARPQGALPVGLDQRCRALGGRHWLGGRHTQRDAFEQPFVDAPSTPAASRSCAFPRAYRGARGAAKSSSVHPAPACARPHRRVRRGPRKQHAPIRGRSLLIETYVAAQLASLIAETRFAEGSSRLKPPFKLRPRCASTFTDWRSAAERPDRTRSILGSRPRRPSSSTSASTGSRDPPPSRLHDRTRSRRQPRRSPRSPPQTECERSRGNAPPPHPTAGRVAQIRDSLTSAVFNRGSLVSDQSIALAGTDPGSAPLLAGSLPLHVLRKCTVEPFAQGVLDGALKDVDFAGQ
jgi:hypothetical protein